MTPPDSQQPGHAVPRDEAVVAELLGRVAILAADDVNAILVHRHHVDAFALHDPSRVVLFLHLALDFLVVREQFVENLRAYWIHLSVCVVCELSMTCTYSVRYKFIA